MFKFALNWSAAVAPIVVVLLSCTVPAGAQTVDRDDDDAPRTAPKPHSQQDEATRAVPPQKADADADDDDDDDGPSAQPKEVVVRAQRLDAAREKVEASLGASTYSVSNALVESRPGGETVSLSQVLLQAPGVMETPSGQLTVRGSSGLQYRINNVILPEGFTDIGESVSARFASRIQLITGALPAQYGLQTGGVVNITTQSGVYQPGGQYELYAGSDGTVEPAIEFPASIGGTNIFVTGSLKHSNIGLDSSDGSASPKHDRTDQFDGFAFLDHALDEQSRLSLILGATSDRFQMPNVSGLDAATQTGPSVFQRPLDVLGIRHYPSDRLGNTQNDGGGYAIVSYQRSTEKLTYQVSGFAHISTYGLNSDPTGDLLFDGISQTARNREISAGLQVEAAYTLSAAHTIRSGLLQTWNRQTSDVSSSVLPLGPNGVQTSDVPLTVLHHASETVNASSIFAEDEWKILETVTLNAGLRFDHVDGPGRGDQLSPRVNLVWTAADGTTVHGGYARYFVPAPDDQSLGATPELAGTSGAPLVLQTDPLRPETDDYLDVGVERKTGHLTLGLDAYARRAKNLIGEAPIGQTLLQRAFNYASGRIHGVELSANYAKGPLVFWSNLAVSKAEGRGMAFSQYAFTPSELAYVGGHYVPLSQSQTYTASGGISYILGRLHLSSDVVYGSGTPRTMAGGPVNGSTMPPYVQANVSALYRIDGLGGKRLDLKLDVTNLFDRRYELSDGTSLGGGVPQWGLRRGVFIGAEQSF